MLAPRTLGAGIVLGLMLGGCGANTAPRLDALADQVAAVGDELTIQLRATDADGDELSFEYACAELGELDRRVPRPSIELQGAGMALFHWIPQADDARAEPYQFDFRVSDGKAEGLRSAGIRVRTQGGSGAPSFVRPLGSGTTLALDEAPCLELELEVVDTDSTRVTLGQESPVIEGATLEETGPFTGIWRWCPTPAQIKAQDRFYLRLSADDGENPKTMKLPPYLIVVIGSGLNTACPGSSPNIAHLQMTAQNTVQDLKIKFSANDDKGLKSTPLLYWSTKDPGSPVVLSNMTPVATVRTSGDASSGEYEGLIPNPIASAPTGTQKTIYYLIAARDNDDPTGGCNHTTYLPGPGSFQFVVTSTGGAGLAACQACTSDAQCGGADDHCITIGGTLRCGTACGTGGSCAAGYTCTINAVTSIDGVSGKQCIPSGGSCAAQSCTDDAFEQNDSMTTILSASAQSLAPMSYPGLMICPLTSGTGVDEDWFGIPVTAEGKIEVVMTSSATTDLDLQLVGSDGLALAYGLSLSSNETVSACVRTTAGKVYARVYASTSAPAPAPYSLQLIKTPMACP